MKSIADAIKQLFKDSKDQLYNAKRTHLGIGMISMDEALVDLYLRKIIASETLFAYCNDRQEVKNWLVG